MVIKREFCGVSWRSGLKREDLERGLSAFEETFAAAGDGVPYKSTLTTVGPAGDIRRTRAATRAETLFADGVYTRLLTSPASAGTALGVVSGPGAKPAAVPARAAGVWAIVCGNVTNAGTVADYLGLRVPDGDAERVVADVVHMAVRAAKGDDRDRNITAYFRLFEGSFAAAFRQNACGEWHLLNLGRPLYTLTGICPGLALFSTTRPITRPSPWVTVATNAVVVIDARGDLLAPRPVFPPPKDGNAHGQTIPSSSRLTRI